MVEPNWEGVERALMSLTVTRLRRLARAHFGGFLGGESTKGAMAREMVCQMRYWWDFGDADMRANARAALCAIRAEVGEK